ncbi:MAG: hypothetical protein NEHIOOID_00634 [Holosporales bacterium]
MSINIKHSYVRKRKSKMFKQHIMFITATASLILSGCTHLRELTPEEFMKDKGLYIKKREIKGSIPQIFNIVSNECYEQSRQMKCKYKGLPRDVPFITVSEKEDMLTMWWKIRNSTMAVVNIKQTSKKNKLLEVEIYAAENIYKESWADRAENYLNKIEKKL